MFRSSKINKVLASGGGVDAKRFFFFCHPLFYLVTNKVLADRNELI